jgi:mannosyl-3-phosphoglycerate phosphatase
MVFTDLDGTLLDHHSYDWSPAAPAIQALKDRSVPIILASSKTAAEISLLRAELELQQWPAIVENGAGVLPAFENDVSTQSVYQGLRDALAAVSPVYRSQYCGFYDMSDEQVARITGLALEDAVRARRRAFSEPGLWLGNDADKAAFVSQLEYHGVYAQQGGRFLTLSFGANKAQQLSTLARQFQPATTIALGDAPNDIEMLEAADIAVIVANPDTTALPTLRTERNGCVLRTSDPGPIGWNATILDLLQTHYPTRP